MGGQLNYFGFFISDNYDTGHCKGHPLSTTFSNPSLSKKQDFTVAEMEVWRVGPIPRSDSDDEDSDNEHAKSILDGNREEKALLELAGITMKSEGVREPFEEVVIDEKTGKAKRPVY